ncbi:unnamed protein product, partial [Nesidiocoris tenuis]
CHSHELQCRNGHCVDKTLVCNGEDDCEDGTDELHCKKEQVTSAGNQSNHRCSPNEFSCQSNNACLPSSSRCDGKADCPLGEDEKGCDGCGLDEFQCSSTRQCISNKWKCDGVSDCTDHSDEKDCTQKVQIFKKSGNRIELVNELVQAFRQPNFLRPERNFYLVIYSSYRGSDMEYVFATNTEIRFKSKSLTKVDLAFKSSRQNLVRGMDIDMSSKVVYWSSDFETKNAQIGPFLWPEKNKIENTKNANISIYIMPAHGITNNTMTIIRGDSGLRQQGDSGLEEEYNVIFNHWTLGKNHLKQIAGPDSVLSAAAIQ